MESSRCFSYNTLLCFRSSYIVHVHRCPLWLPGQYWWPRGWYSLCLLHRQWKQNVNVPYIFKICWMNLYCCTNVSVWVTQSCPEIFSFWCSCWPSYQKSFIWAYIIPVMIIFAVSVQQKNIFVLCFLHNLHLLFSKLLFLSKRTMRFWSRISFHHVTSFLFRWLW